MANLVAWLAVAVTGAIPPALTAPSRVVWIDDDPSRSIACSLVSSQRWTCSSVPEGARGVVVVIGLDAVAYQTVNGTGVARTVVHRWGHVVVLPQGAVAPEDLRSLRWTAWALDRPAFRRQATRFIPARDSTIDIVPLSDGMVWLSGDVTDPDAFVRVDGPAIASMRIPVSSLTEGAPDVPLNVSVGLPFSLVGRVEDDRGEDVQGAEIELFEPLAMAAEPPGPGFDSLPMVRRELAHSDQRGSFTFDRLTSGPFLVAVTDASLVHRNAVVKVPGEPLVIRLTPRPRATGRVLREGLPVSGARVRFVPTAEALTASSDPRELLSEEQLTGDDGRFSLPLPSARSGLVQIIGVDGTSVRVAPPGAGADHAMALGDINLPDHRRLSVRVMDPSTCQLYATGPLGSLGLTILEPTTSGNVHWFDISEPGEWALNAECAGRDYPVEPHVVTVPASGPELTVDVRIVK